MSNIDIEKKDYYLIYFGEELKGYTPSRKVIRNFLSQRNGYDIYAVNENELYSHDIESIDDYSEVFQIGSKILFQEEEEYFFLSLSQYYMDLKNYMVNLFHYIKFTKLTDDEKDTIKKSFRILYNLLIELEDYDSVDNEELLSYVDIFDLDKMLEHIADV